MKVMHVIAALDGGGAETMLYQLLKAQIAPTHLAHAVSLTDMIGLVGRRIEGLGVPVSALGMKRGRVSPAGFVRLVRLMAREKPDLIQTWMYHADLLGGIAARTLGIPVIWGVRHEYNPRDKALTRLTRRTCALLSTWMPESVVFNSESSLRGHARGGYAARKLVVIHNGFDLSSFRPDARTRIEVRRELGIPEDAPVVGLVARHHPDKDHGTFVAAAARIRERCGSARFVLCGKEVEWSNSDLVALLDRYGLRPAAHLLGNRLDVERLYAALDVACLSSRTESFPNVLGEAMACGVPCVSTDCGAVREIVGETGYVVPVGDSEALAAGVLRLLRLDETARAALGAAVRLRIMNAYDLAAVVQRFDEVQGEAIQGRNDAVSRHGNQPRRTEDRAS
ncbi:MAG: phosphatidylinositol alpha-mannosyltransferase [Acidobacteria bacterium]|nr:MAG: phosphatidylinositol alpha-mannosyltransferase [Acidobacteriota bacterium]